MTIRKGDYVFTPRFHKVCIEKVFATEAELARNGFTEPTYFQDDDYVIHGKVIGVNTMIFAAAHRKRRP